MLSFSLNREGFSTVHGSAYAIILWKQPRISLKRRLRVLVQQLHKTSENTLFQSLVYQTSAW